MSRVALIDGAQAPLKARPFYADGEPAVITRALAQVPELLEKAMPFIGAIYGPSAIAQRPKEIVVLRTSARYGCRFCTQTHSAVARRAGLTVEEVRWLRAASGDVALEDEAERVLVRWTDRMADAGAPIGEEIHSALAAHYADHEIVELTMIAGATMMLNRFCTALDLPTSPATLEALAAEDLL